MKHDLSPEDIDGILHQDTIRRRQEAEQAEYDREQPASLTGGYLFGAFVAAVIVALLCIGWSLAK
jgi:hypothetical protein